METGWNRRKISRTGLTFQYTKSDKAGIKLDWNISSKHNASLRWSLVSAKQLNATSSASSLNTSDYSYDFVSKTNTFIGELQSRFSDNLSNELRLSYVNVRDRRDPGDPFPMISISNVGGGTVNIGNERSSMMNALDQDIWSLTDNLTLYAGNHTFTVGTHNELYTFKNLFIQDIYGTYEYNSPADFANGKIRRYRYQVANTSVTGDPHWAAQFSAGQLGFYAQDKWNVTDNFDLTYGIRMDIPLFLDTPTENATFNSYAESQGWNYKTNRKLSSSPIFSPRVGFRWSIDKENKFILRGGTGVFTGRIPFVWLSNSFTNTGMQFMSYNTTSTGGLSLILDPNKQADNVASLTASGTQTINVFSEKFKFAQNLRFNLGFDFELGGIDWTADAIYSKTLNDIFYQNLAYDLNGSTLGQTIPALSFDQRPMFAKRSTAGTYTGIYALSNTNKGYSYSLSLKGEKKFAFGLDLMASYTFTRSKAVNSGTNSVAASNWNFNYIRGNSNEPELYNSAFNIPHRINASVYYHKTYGRWTTTVGLIYTGSTGAPYSIQYSGDLNGDSSNGNDLFFIPTDEQIDAMPFRANVPPKGVTWTDEQKNADIAQQKANMKAWIANDGYLSKHRGEYYERYADNEAFEHHFDLHLAQKFSFRAGNTMHALELSLDIINIGNMFNKKWGRTSSSSGSAAYYTPVTYNSSSKAFQFLGGANYDMRSYSDYYSRWRGQIGLKYTF